MSREGGTYLFFSVSFKIAALVNSSPSESVSSSVFRMSLFLSEFDLFYSSFFAKAFVGLTGSGASLSAILSVKVFFSSFGLVAIALAI